MNLSGQSVKMPVTAGATALQAHKKDGFRWWSQRLGRAFHMHNETRIDHFRGFAGYWAVPADAETAMGGTWRRGPGKELFDALTEVCTDCKIM